MVSYAYPKNRRRKLFFLSLPWFLSETGPAAMLKPGRLTAERGYDALLLVGRHVVDTHAADASGNVRIKFTFLPPVRW